MRKAICCPRVTVGGVTYDVFGAEVELGRLSVGRAPEKVLTHSLDEALSKLTAAGAVIAVDSTGRLTVNGVTIDSPLENLALYDKYMTTGSLPGVTLPADFNPAALLAAAGGQDGHPQRGHRGLHELHPGDQHGHHLL